MIVLKKGKEKPILQRHHWIYSGAIQSYPFQESAPIVPVYSSSRSLLGYASLNRGHSIAAYMLSFGSQSVEEAITERIREAFCFRRKWFDPSQTNAYRLINAEGDGIPGLIIDSYDNHLVMQISQTGIESMKDLLISILIREAAPKGISEKSTSFLRKKGGLEPIQKHLWGEKAERVIILENGLQFLVDLEKGQKTGWFLDQREMRQLVRSHASQRKVLNVFAYTGGFSVAAIDGGATHVDSVEISSRCEEFMMENLKLNQLPEHKHRMICQDAFDFLKDEMLDYDLIILDPPAFVKKREDIAAAFRAYKDLNYLAMSKMKAGSMLMTSSCSYHVDEALFQNILFRAALEANRQVKIIGRHRQAIDHPVSIFHPESVYLKSLFLYVE
jgi:23S rRNA (cytosine1962-C5)-methyltransferase